MLRTIGRCLHFGRRSIQFSPFVVVVRLLGRRLVENDPVCDPEGVTSLDGSFLVGCVNVGIGCYCSFDESDVFFTVAGFLL